MKKKERLDIRVQQEYPHLSRTYVHSLIMQGKVTVDGVPMTKQGTPIALEATIVVYDTIPKYVCRAGFKLEHALDFFECDVTGLVALDAGLSTGGFTDCLLQRGAARVYGVDVGYGQVHEKIKQNLRVVVMERTNLRNVTSIGEQVDIITLDLSFISVLKVMEVVVSLLKPDGVLIVLIKPQFEAERKDVKKGGIVRDPEIHQRVQERLVAGIVAHGFVCTGVTESPIHGTMGNKEFLGCFKKCK
jgi:23S rRNA (cytidine1920-2'-O)/16S rRNA (cytidine1409-2'-O)-methyltransferase